MEPILNLPSSRRSRARACRSWRGTTTRAGADDERCVRRNREAFEQIALHYRVLVDVAHRDLATTVLGQRDRDADRSWRRRRSTASRTATASSRRCAAPATRARSSCCRRCRTRRSRTWSRRRAGRCGSSSTSTAIAARPRRWCGASRRRAAARSCSPSMRRCSGGASATCAIGSRCRRGSAIENLHAAGYARLPRGERRLGARRVRRRPARSGADLGRDRLAALDHEAAACS